MNCRENRYIFLPPPHPYPTGGGGLESIKIRGRVEVREGGKK